MSLSRFVSPDLDAAVANIYAVFEPYLRRSRELNVCNCPSCISLEDERKLVATPLGDIPAKLLTQYTHAAVTWDERASFEMRYFLPRYCELIAHDEPPSQAGETSDCLSRLGRYANWRQTWPSSEVTALEKFFVALLQDRLSRIETVSHDSGLFSPRERIEDVLALAITAGAALSPLLATWNTARDPGAVLHMAAIRFNVRHYDNSHPPRLPTRISTGIRQRRRPSRHSCCVTRSPLVSRQPFLLRTVKLSRAFWLLQLGRYGDSRV